MRATQATSSLIVVVRKNPRDLICSVQNPSGWPAFAGHDN